MNVTNGSLPPPSPPDLEQIVLKELVGRQWIGWCIASVLLLGSACFVAHGCWVQCCSNYAVLRAWLSGRNSRTATKGAGGLPAQAMRPRCHRLSHPLTVSTPAALFISSASPVCSEPLLTHSIPNIQSLSPTTLRLIHRRYCKHSADDEDSSTSATTPAAPLPLVVSVPSDTPPRSPTTLPKSTERTVVVAPAGDQPASEVADLSV